MVVFDMWKDEDGLHKERDETATDAWNRRERALWRDLWKLPQAIAWHMPKYRYLFNTVALYCRQFVLCETADAKAADRATLARYADTIGLTPQASGSTAGRSWMTRRNSRNRPHRRAAR